MVEIAEGVAAAAEGIVVEVRAAAVVRAVAAIAVLVVAVEIAATAKSANSNWSLSCGHRSQTAGCYFAFGRQVCHEGSPGVRCGATRLSTPRYIGLPTANCQPLILTPSFLLRG